MKKIIASLLVSVFLLSACKKDDNNNTNSPNATDIDFTQKAWMANNFELEMGELAAFKSIDPAIESFGQTMVTEHGEAKIQLQAIATDLRISLPDSLDAESVGIRAQLIDLDNRPFDSVYIHNMVLAHQKTITLFQLEISSGKNDRLVSFATLQLPHLQSHLQTAEGIAANY